MHQGGRNNGERRKNHICVLSPLYDVNPVPYGDELSLLDDHSGFREIMLFGILHFTLDVDDTGSPLLT